MGTQGQRKGIILDNKSSPGSAPLNCDGYRKLIVAVEHDEKKFPCSHDYRGKLEWIVARAKQYAEKTGLAPESILDAWEKKRNYWYMNYYQDANQPPIANDTVRIFNTVADLRESVGKAGFRCPYCKAISKSPIECDSGAKIDGKICNWKVYGLFGHMGKGVSVFVKEAFCVENIFMPVAWEQKTDA